MRDLLLAAFVFGTLPFIFKRPYLGVLLVSWLGYMNPHRMTWGFAYNLPFVMIAASTTLLATMIYMLNRRMKTTYGPSLFSFDFSIIILMIFVLWLCLTTITAINPTHATDALVQFIKVQIVVFLTLYLVNNKERLLCLVGVITFSIAFFGIKGGMFAIATGGSYRVWGPEKSFIFGNNEIALALIMVLPFVYFFYSYFSNKWIKYGLIFCALLMIASIITSYSRGAFLALICMGLFLWAHSKNKVGIGVVAVLLVMLALPLMPSTWFERMDTIKTYEEDASAQGRINAWHMAYNLASDRVVGGGFDVWGPKSFMMYAPDPSNVKDAHSIYFEVLGEHGFIGLFLLLLFYLSIWFKASKSAKAAKMTKNMAWAGNLLAMCKVSLIGYASGGAFLGLAFFDLPYHIGTFVLLVSKLVDLAIADEKPSYSHGSRSHPFSGSGVSYRVSSNHRK